MPLATPQHVQVWMFSSEPETPMYLLCSVVHSLMLVMWSTEEDHPPSPVGFNSCGLFPTIQHRSLCRPFWTSGLRGQAERLRYTLASIAPMLYYITRTFGSPQYLGTTSSRLVLMPQWSPTLPTAAASTTLAKTCMGNRAPPTNAAPPSPVAASPKVHISPSRYRN